MTTLTHADIRDLLAGFASAIELDQLRIDAMPAERFRPPYDDNMWREWRHDHITYINKLLSTVDAISPATLDELSGIAISYEPQIVYGVALELFAGVVSGCLAEDFGTAGLFFAALVEQMGREAVSNLSGQDDEHPILQWFPVCDPLRIAQDPECGYGTPTGLVS